MVNGNGQTVASVLSADFTTATLIFTIALTAERGWMLLLKLLQECYLKGRKEGFDHGFNVAKMVYTDVANDLKRQVEELNSEIIFGKQEEDDDDL